MIPREIYEFFLRSILPNKVETLKNLLSEKLLLQVHHNVGCIFYIFRYSLLYILVWYCVDYIEFYIIYTIHIMTCILYLRKKGYVVRNVFQNFQMGQMFS